MAGILTRDDIIDGLREIITRLRGVGRTATIQIVGGAAIALTIDGDRPATVDVDGPFTPLKDVEAIAVQIARERAWPLDWMNDKAKIFLPDGMGRNAEWVTLHDQAGIVVQTASPAMLLAMKLRSVERRGLRDIDDVAEHLLNEFFPAEDLSPTTHERVQKLLDAGLPFVPRPSPPDFSPDQSAPDETGVWAD
jgi:hypothetical protein